MRAIEVATLGGPEVLSLVERPLPEPGPGQVRVRHHAIGLNMIDVYYRTGLYPARLPTGVGVEAAGVVDAVGPGAEGVEVGTRVGYVGQLGAYAEFGRVAADRLIRLPEAISFELAAAALLKGMTAEFLAERMAPLEASQSALVYAAAGGVGAILTQWLAKAGAQVIAVVGSADKAARAQQSGAVHTIDYSREDVAARVRELTRGEGVRVAYDSVGKATFEATLASIGRRGWFISYGNASGAVPAFEPLRLARAGSLVFSRPTLFDYIDTPEALARSSAALFARIERGAVTIEIGRRYPLGEAAEAHRALEARQTTGSTILLP